MKKLFLFILLAIIVNIGLFSEEIENYSKNEDKDRKWTIQTSPHYYIADIFLLTMAGSRGIPDTGALIIDLEGQYKINDLFNISLAFSYFTFFYHNDWQIHIKPMFIYRPLKTGLKGFYIGLYPIIGLFDIKTGLEIFNENGSMEWINYGRSVEIGVGLDIGYKWVFKRGFSLQLGGGIGKACEIPSFSGFLIRSDGRVSLDFFDIDILDLSFDLKLGYSF